MSEFDYTYAERWNRDVTGNQYQKFYIETPVEDAVITVGAEESNVVTVTVQVVDPAGDPIGRQTTVEFFVCSDADCHTIAAISNTVIAEDVGSDAVILKAITAAAHLLVVTDDTGEAVLTITQNPGATATAYCSVMLPNGTYVVAEDAISFTA